MSRPTAQRSPRIITGRHMWMIFIAFFGTIIAVNFTMAYLAVSGFGGTVVDNSYVASQHYNRWLAEGRAQAALGWQATAVRDDGDRVVVTVTDREGAAWIGTASGTLRAVMGRAAERPLDFVALGNGVYRSRDAAPPVRQRLRLTLTQGERAAHYLVDLP